MLHDSGAEARREKEDGEPEPGTQALVYPLPPEEERDPQHGGDRERLVQPVQREPQRCVRAARQVHEHWLYQQEERDRGQRDLGHEKQPDRHDNGEGGEDRYRGRDVRRPNEQRHHDQPAQRAPLHDACTPRSQDSRTNNASICRLRGRSCCRTDLR